VGTAGGIGTFSYLSAEVWRNGARNWVGGWGGGGSSYGQSLSLRILSLTANDFVTLGMETSKTFSLDGAAVHSGLAGFLLG
jgi:hypothetical protein